MQNQIRISRYCSHHAKIWKHCLPTQKYLSANIRKYIGGTFDFRRQSASTSSHLGVLSEQSRDSHGITLMVTADKLDNEIMTQTQEQTKTIRSFVCWVKLGIAIITINYKWVEQKWRWIVQYCCITTTNKKHKASWSWRTISLYLLASHCEAEGSSV